MIFGKHMNRYYLKFAPMLVMGVLVLRDSWRTYKIHTYKPDCVETNVLESADKKP